MMIDAWTGDFTRLLYEIFRLVSPIWFNDIHHNTRELRLDGFGAPINDASTSCGLSVGNHGRDKWDHLSE